MSKEYERAKEIFLEAIGVEVRVYLHMLSKYNSGYAVGIPTIILVTQRCVCPLCSRSCCETIIGAIFTIPLSVLWLITGMPPYVWQRVAFMLSRICASILSSQVDCVEAIYNLGLVNIHLGLPGDSLQAFEKLHTIIPNNTEVIYHIANLYEVREPHQDRLVHDSGQRLVRPYANIQCRFR